MYTNNTILKYLQYIVNIITITYIVNKYEK